MYAGTFGAATQGVDGLIISVEIKAHSNIRQTFCDCACRFDVVEVFTDGERVEEIHHIENAFEVTGEV